MKQFHWNIFYYIYNRKLPQGQLHTIRKTNKNLIIYVTTPVHKLDTRYLLLNLVDTFEHCLEPSGSTQCQEFHNKTEDTWRSATDWASPQLPWVVMLLFPENFLTFLPSYPAILLTRMLAILTMLQPSLLTSASLCVTWLPTFYHGKSPFLTSTTTSISLAIITWNNHLKYQLEPQFLNQC